MQVNQTAELKHPSDFARVGELLDAIRRQSPGVTAVPHSGLALDDRVPAFVSIIFSDDYHGSWQALQETARLAIKAVGLTDRFQPLR